MTELDQEPETTEEPDALHFMTKKFAFQALLEKAAPVVPSRDIQPVLRNFLVEANSGLRVAATDLEMTMVAIGQLVVVKQEGICLLPATKMLSIVREAEDGEMEVEVKNGEAHIAIGPTTWTLAVADSGDYPQLPDEAELQFTVIDRAQFVNALSAVQYAASRDALKPGFMMIDVSGGKMRAADGIRFQEVKVEGTPDIQIPVGAVGDLLKVLRATEVPKIGVGQDEYQLVFQVGLDVFMSSRLSTAFPNVDEVLLKPVANNNQELRCNRADLVSAIRRVRITADEETAAVVLEMSEDGLRVSSKDKYGSWAAESVDAEWKHPDRTAAFNWQHLLEMLQQTDTKVMSMKFGKDSPSRPSAALLEGVEGTQGVLHQLRID